MKTSKFAVNVSIGNCSWNKASYELCELCGLSGDDDSLKFYNAASEHGLATTDIFRAKKCMDDFV